MNEEVALKQKEDEPIRDIENFRKQYAMVLLQLRDSNDTVSCFVNLSVHCSYSVFLYIIYERYDVYPNLCQMQVASALLYLRKRNTFVGNSTSPHMGTVDSSNGTTGPTNSLNESVVIDRYSGSHVVEIVESSRCKAKTMVDLSVQVM